MVLGPDSADLSAEGASGDPLAGGSASLEETIVSQSIAGAKGAARSAGPGRGERTGELGRYALLGRVGVGGMGEVYAAYDPELDRRVAIKVLHAGRDRGDAILRLRREAQALARLRHENVVSVHDVGEAQGVSFVAMEFVQGETLREWLLAERTPREILRAFVDAGRGLLAAHQQGLVHRDFKPENVMVEATGRVVVMDFGLARGDEAQPTAEGAATDRHAPLGASGVLDADSALGLGSGASSNLGSNSGRSGSVSGSLTRTGAVLGTPAYMSPEQHLGQPADARSDQFSWCVALWEALYKQRPFVGRTLAKLAFAVTQGDLQAPTTSVELPPHVHKAMQRGLSVRVGDRFADMHELLAAVRPETPESVWRRPAAWVVAGGLAFALGLSAWAMRPDKLPACPDYTHELERSWGTPQRAAVAARFEQAPALWAKAAHERSVRALDRAAKELADVRAQSCRETRLLGAQSDEAMDLRMACLRGVEREMVSLVEVLSEADDAALTRASGAAEGLSSSVACLNVERLRRGSAGLPAPGFSGAEALEQGLARMEALRRTGQVKLGLELAEALAPDLSEDAGLSLRARFALSRGQLWIAARDKLKSSEALTLAFALATEAGLDASAADAAVALVRALGGVGGDLPGALRWAEVARSFNRKAEGDPAREARIENHVGIAFDQANQSVRARPHFERSVELYVVQFGANDLRAASPLANLGVSLELQKEYAGAKRAYARAVATLEAGLGPHHPRVGRVHNNLSGLLQLLGDHESALEHSRRAVEIAQGALGVGAPGTASALVNRCWGRLHIGAFDHADADCAAAVEILERANPNERARVVTALLPTAWSHELRGNFEAAVELRTEILNVDEASYGEQDAYVCLDRANLAHAHALAGQWPQARELAQAVLARVQAAAAAGEAPLDCAGVGHLVMGLSSAQRGESGAAREQLELAQAFFGPLPEGYRWEKDRVGQLADQLADRSVTAPTRAQ